MRHRLEGLEPDNLLAIMALLGLIRCLDRARSEWRARTFWDLDTRPIRSVLVLSVEAGRDEIATAATDGLLTLAAAHEFGGRKDLHTLRRAEARELLAEAEALGPPTRPENLAALFSDGACRDDGAIVPTPFCLQFGISHQHFLDRLARVPAASVSARSSDDPRRMIADRIAESLFEPWARSHASDGFRWDPAEDRRHALRAVAPTVEKSLQQDGANRLAAIGLATLPGTCVVRKGRAGFSNIMTGQDVQDRGAFHWRLWSDPARLCGIQALLAAPDRLIAKADYAFEATTVSAGRLSVVTVGRLRTT